MKRQLGLNLLTTMSVLVSGMLMMPQQANAEEYHRERRGRERGGAVVIEYRNDRDVDEYRYERLRYRREEERRRCEEERRRREEREERERRCREARYRERQREEERCDRRREDRQRHHHHEYNGGHETHW